jgi:RNA polymerase sigma factor (sigma-70 family)
VNNTDTEIFLLEGLSREDKGSIERIYKDNFSMIQHMILQNSGTNDDAADIFQEAMMVLFEKSRSADFTLNCQLKTFIYSVCRRLWLKKLNQSQRFSLRVEGLEDTIPLDDEMETHEKRQEDFLVMENAMNKIGEPCKSLLNAYYVQKKQMQEIAANFGYTNADNAKTQKYKCLVRLKKLFFAQYKYPA